MIIVQLRRCPSQVQAADQEDLLVHSKVCMNVVAVEALCEWMSGIRCVVRLA